MTYTGDSMNIAFYRDGGVIVEVLEAAMVKRNGKWRVRARPVYHGTVYRNGIGEVARFNYQPSRARKGRLPERTVAQLTRKALA